MLAGVDNEIKELVRLIELKDAARWRQLNNANIGGMNIIQLCTMAKNSPSPESPISVSSRAKVVRDFVDFIKEYISL
jgi:hypothetical protein